MHGIATANAQAAYDNADYSVDAVIPQLYIAGMTRVTHHLTDAQLTWLNREAKKLGISVADLLRRIIDEARSK